MNRPTHWIVNIFLASVTFGIPPCPAQENLSQDEINRAVKEVMEHDDFRSVRRRTIEQDQKGLLERFFDWLDEAISESEGGSSGGSSGAAGAGASVFLKVLMFAMIALIVVVIVVVIVIIVRSLDRSKRELKSLDLPVSLDQAAGISVPPGEQAVSIYEQRAEQYAAEGNYRAAIRELLLGSMSWIERAGLIRFRKGLTNRDYIRVIWRNEPHRQSYYTIATNFELVYFGRRTATQEMYQTSLAGFQGAFRETETRQTHPAV